MGVEEFKAQYLPYQQKLYRVAFRILEDSFDAEDAVQEVYIKLWNKRNELGSIQNCEAFCVVLAKNLCLDFLRKSKKNIRPIHEAEVVKDMQLPDVFEIKDELEYVKSLLDYLPEQEKRILILKHCEGFSNEEIEDITGFSNVYIRVLLSRGRKKIKELVSKEWKRNSIK